MTSVVVGTAGHIDHGKSALVRALTGTDPDRLKEEKARGITIDLGFAHTQLADVNAAFVDVPGHERFVKNMLAGVGGIDLVLLVVAANEGVMPQTREHFDICRLLRIDRGLVAISKIDLVDAAGVARARDAVRHLVRGSLLEHAPVIPVSAVSGEGLDALRQSIAALAVHAGPRPNRGPARLPIDRVFSMKGFGTVVTGTLVSGVVRPGDVLEAVPGGRRLTIRGVQVHGASRDSARAGERAALNVAGADLADLSRGLTLVTPGALTTTQLADVVLDMLGAATPLKDGARVRFHQGTAEIIARVSLVGRPGASAGSAGPLAAGASGHARLRLERPAALTRGDRFILRTYSPALTLAGGTVLDPAPPSTGTRTATSQERFRDLAAASERGAIARMIDDAAAAGLPVASLVARGGIAPSLLEETVLGLTQDGRARQVGDRLVAMPVFEAAARALVAALEDHHRAQPGSDGLPREEARARALKRGSPLVFDRVVADLAGAGVVAGRERLRLASHGVGLSPEESTARAAIERTLLLARFTPPLADALAVTSGVSPALANRVLRGLQRDQRLVKVQDFWFLADTLAATTGVSPALANRVLRGLQRDQRLVKVQDFWFHADVLTALKSEVLAMKQEGGGQEGGATLDVAAFKARFGVTRKFAIPLLEYLDRERVTRRAGDARIIL